MLNFYTIIPHNHLLYQQSHDLLFFLYGQFIYMLTDLIGKTLYIQQLQALIQGQFMCF